MHPVLIVQAHPLIALCLISEWGSGAPSNNIGRNSMIGCTTPAGSMSCDVYYHGSDFKKG
jgi:hypothetical protein